MTDELRSRKIKVYEITPSGDSRFDSICVKAEDSWTSGLRQVEDTLEKQFLDEKEWEEISATIKCKYMTEEQFNNLENE